MINNFSMSPVFSLTFGGKVSYYTFETQCNPKKTGKLKGANLRIGSHSGELSFFERVER